MFGYIYITKNLIDNKQYIGKHASSVFEPENYMGSGKYLEYAFAKYGLDNFTQELIEWCEDEETLNEREKHWISFYNAVESDMFYNIGEGGNGYSHKGHISIVKDSIQKFIPPEELNSYLLEGWEKRGITPTQEVIDKRVAGMVGKKHPTAGANIAKKNRGLKRSEEVKRLMSEVRKNKPAHIKGKILVRKINEDNAIQIDPKDLQKYLNAGYIKGGSKHKVPGQNLNKLKIHNGKETLFINKEDFPIWEVKGYVPGQHFGTNKGLIAINNGVENKMVKPQDLDHYRNLGYIEGFIKRKN